MLRMFDFLLDADNYEERKVARFEGDDVVVSTAACSDGEQPYETGILHGRYNNGKWIIVEAYDTREKAEAGHAKWVATMAATTLPAVLKDCTNAEMCKLFPDDATLAYERGVE